MNGLINSMRRSELHGEGSFLFVTCANWNRNKTRSKYWEFSASFSSSEKKVVDFTGFSNQNGSWIPIILVSEINFLWGNDVRLIEQIGNDLLNHDLWTVNDLIMWLIDRYRQLINVQYK